MKKFSELHLRDEAIGGLSAGILGTIIGFPLDVVKTRMQTGGAVGGNIVAVGSHVIRTEGISGMYKGVGPPLISLSILNTMTFASYTFFREIWQANPGWDFRNGLSGMSCAPFAGVVSTVENLVKTQMQLDNITNKQYQSSFQCFKTLVRFHGPLVVYTGHGINTLRETVFLGNYFFVYEGMRQFLLDHYAIGPNSGSMKIAVPVAGGLAGALSWFVSFPLDCVRAGVQGQPLDQQAYKSAWRVASELIKTRGLRGLYAGASASIARAFLVSGSRFSAYEGALWLLRGGREVSTHHD